MTIMERLDALSRHLLGRKADDFDYEADARNNHARMMGHDLTLQERRARVLQMTQRDASDMTQGDVTLRHGGDMTQGYPLGDALPTFHDHGTEREAEKAGHGFKDCPDPPTPVTMTTQRDHSHFVTVTGSSGVRGGGQALDRRGARAVAMS